MPSYPLEPPTDERSQLRGFLDLFRAPPADPYKSVGVLVGEVGGQPTFAGNRLARVL